jgi:hypothetical protein
MKEESESNADIRNTLAAPLLVRENDGSLTVMCDDQIVCANLIHLKDATALLISTFYAFHMSFPPKIYEKTLCLLAFLCGADEMKHKFRVVTRLIEFVKRNEFSF